MEVKAQANYIRISPRKVRLVTDVIRGMNVARAELELEHLSKRASLPVMKLLRSARANARKNFNIEDDSQLFIKETWVDPGPMLKRFRPRAFGRAAMIRKRTSHIVMVLDTKEKAGDTNMPATS